MGKNSKNQREKASHLDFVGKIFTNIFVSEDRTTVKFISDSGECMIIGAVGEDQNAHIDTIAGNVRDLIGTRILDVSLFLYQHHVGSGLFLKMTTCNFTTEKTTISIRWSGYAVGALSEQRIVVHLEELEDRLLHAVPIQPESLVGKVLIEITTSPNRDAVYFTTNTLEKYIMTHKKTARELVYLENTLGIPERLRWSEITKVQVLVSEKFPLGHYNKNTAYFISTKECEVVFKWEGNSDGENVDVGVFKMVPMNIKGENTI